MSRKPKFAPDVEAAIIGAYNGGEPIKSIATRFGSSVPAIQLIRKRHGVAPRPPKPPVSITAAQQAEVADLVIRARQKAAADGCNGILRDGMTTVRAAMLAAGVGPGDPGAVARGERTKNGIATIIARLRAYVGES